MKISWTPTARRTYFNILDYLAEKWTKKEVVNFIFEVEKLLVQIVDNPKMSPASRGACNDNPGSVMDIPLTAFKHERMNNLYILSGIP